MTPTEQRQRLRAILAGTKCLTPASVYDALSARIAQSVGYELGMLAGSVSANTVLASPDLIVITLTEFADQVRRIMRYSTLSLMTDADHGYGNALNVMRTVEELEHAGVSGLSIEDTVLPTPFGAEKETLVPLAEGVGKMKAALEARGDSDLVIFGRTSAPAITGIDDAVARCIAYESAGVDALMLPGLRTREDLDRISAAVKLPIMSGSPAESMCDETYLASRNVRVWSNGHQTLNVAMNALFEAMKAVRGGTLASKLPGAASKTLMNTITAAADYDGWTMAYLGRG